MTRSIRPDAVLIQAVIAGALSFAHLHDIAAAAGQDGWKAWAYPVSVDLLLVAAWRRLRILRAAGEPARAAWTWFTVALAASLGANVATAGLLDLHNVPAWLRILVAGWPAIAFLGGTLLVHTPATDKAPVAEQAADVALTRHVPAPVPAPEPEPVAGPVPALPPAVPVPAALVAHARKVADAHRTATGAPIDADTLRARLGVPGPMADALALQLTGKD
ncbi:DUF2637 domain-containing protein [Streptomyces lunaelactis]|uniref:DUF2637 domain-containing protein n=1 Tax=Streptomyces lunaelactis TaxID=1535768 RepID=UPI0015854292|nr:DUF2637 domain-containing protein [Streptomyces lunaelactis]NUK09396.1 DUF2637 domain-containing protein [Streptomyces lunaelactis]NUK36032.1 DUF2637 domain-containing protein [Streptomyces lunaelactis]NUK44283.1 DUF2637 domain-containing protein [Streptomyces lunaelactis]NUK58344.1 DUF2637 domain-containing protein [Streptomyces lunaelactis]NUK94956.1 DUF2637 domain-containing protein [Streptomyces lunaelactis]